MNIQVRSREIQVWRSVRSHVERRLEFSLGRRSSHIREVIVHIEDVNGPRGGKDKCCRIEVRLRPTGSVFAEETSADFHAAIDGAADRSGQAVSRALERARRIHREALARRLAVSP